MYKRIFLSILLIALIGGLNAQHINDKVLYGIKGGVNFPRLNFTETNLRKLPHDFMITPTVSLFVEFKIREKCSMAVELNYQQRGGATSYVYENDYKVHYKLLADYASARLPFFVYLSNNNTISPYLMLSPEFSYALGGNISLTQPGLPIPEASVKISDANIKRFNFGILVGIGVRRNVELNNWIFVMKADVALNFGLLNTFSPSETKETATPTNVYAYNSQEKRRTMGFELNLSIGISKNNSSKAKHSSRKNHSNRNSSDCYPWN